MSLFDIMEVEKKFVIGVGDYIHDDLVPLFREAFKYGREFREDNKFIMSIRDYTCWTAMSDEGTEKFYVDTGIAVFKISMLTVTNIVSIHETWHDGSKDECIFIDMGDGIQEHKEYRYTFNPKNTATIKDIVMWFASCCEAELREYHEKYNI